MSHITRREMLSKMARGALGAAALTCLPESLFAGGKKPNFLFILADDLGWMDTSLYGSKFYETPNIERLAKRGMMFTQAYAHPLCSPTRSSLMTGLYPARIGITSAHGHLPEVVLEKSLRDKSSPRVKVQDARSLTRLKQEYFTLTEALKQGGYKTGHFGKWHLGREPYDPLHQGFDVDVPHTFTPGPQGGYFAPWSFTKIPSNKGEHIEDRMADEVIKFIKENKYRPFFANYWCFSVHSPYTAKEDLVAKYKKKADPKNPQHNPIMGAMVETMDKDIGRVLDALEEQGLTDNTIVIFYSDNGGVDFNETGEGGPMTSNLPLRAGKASIYEGGVREPCVVSWPGVIKPGTKSEEIVSSIDWYPTILEMAGFKPQPKQQFDGISITPALKGKHLDREAIFCHFPHKVKCDPATSVRKGDYKLIRFYTDNDDGTDRHELYNLRNDIGETTDLSAKMPEKVKELSALIDKFLKDTEAVVPKRNPNYNPKLAAQTPKVKNNAKSRTKDN